MSRSKFYAGAVALCLLAAMPLTAQAPSMTDMYAKIKAEETNNSKIMWIIHEVADVHGPRVTGTPGLKAADDWAVATIQGGFARLCSFIDRWFINGILVQGSATAVWFLGFCLRFLQVGNIQAYAFFFGAGVIALIYVLLTVH